MTQLKSYYTATVEAAMARAKQDHGPDIMFVESKATGPELRHLGDCQVTFAISSQSLLSDVLPKSDPGASLESEICQLRRMMDRMYLQICRESKNLDPNGPWLNWEVRLLEAGFEPTTAGKAIAAAMTIKAEPTAAIRRALASMIQIRENWFSAGQRSTLMVVGPPGAGKTTTLVKLAAKAAVEERRRCLILSLDTERVAATAMLQELAVILGVPFQAVDSAASFSQAIQDASSRNLILVDTPGFGGREGSLASSLASSILSAAPNLETHLVIPATMNFSDLAHLAKRFQSFRPNALAFTRLDETRKFGTIWNEASRWGLPVSFASYGQSIPEDIVMPKAADLADLVLRGGVQ